MLTRSLCSFFSIPVFLQKAAHLQEIRQKRGRDEYTIRAASKMESLLVKARALHVELKALDSTLTTKNHKKLTEREIEERHVMVKLLWQEIESLTSQVSPNRRFFTPDEEAMRIRVEAQKAQQEHKIRAKRDHAKRKARDRKPRDSALRDDMELEMVTEPIDPTQQAFLVQVEENKEHEEKVLTEIDKGLGDLLNIANEQNKIIRIQDTMLTEVEKNMDEVTANFKSANRRLKDILKNSGGMSRWCPILIFLVVILALIGYIVSIR